MGKASFLSTVGLRLPLLALCAALLLAPASAQVLFSDNFESYPLGSALPNQGGWEQGGQSPLDIVSPGFNSDRAAETSGSRDVNIYHSVPGGPARRLSLNVKTTIESTPGASITIAGLDNQPYAGAAFLAIQNGKFVVRSEGNFGDTGVAVPQDTWVKLVMVATSSTVTVTVFAADGTPLGSASVATVNPPPYSLVVVKPDSRGLSNPGIFRMDIDNLLVEVTPCSAPNTGTVAYWCFDEGPSETVAHDGTGDHDATLVNGARFSTPLEPRRFGPSSLALDGSAFTFGSQDQAITQNAQAPNVPFGAPFTYETWIYHTSVGATRFIGQHGAGGQGFQFYLTATDHFVPAGTLRFDLFTSAGTFSGNDVVTVPFNTWTHAALSWDGSTARLYKNGALVASTATSGTIGPGTGTVVIGNGFNGFIDEACLSNVARTFTPQSVANTPSPCVGAAPPPPCPTGPSVLFCDNFESYPAGSSLPGQGGWQQGSTSAAIMNIVSPGFNSNQAGETSGVRDVNIYHSISGSSVMRLSLNVKTTIESMSGSVAIAGLDNQPYSGAAFLAIQNGRFVVRSEGNFGDTGVSVPQDVWVNLVMVATASTVSVTVFAADGTLLGSASVATVTAPPYSLIVVKPDSRGLSNPGIFRMDIDNLQVDVVPDQTPPTTTATATAGGAPYTFGTFTNQDVTVTLTCTDNPGGSGCKETRYCTAASACSPSTVYTGNIVITTEGSTQVCYRSEDNAGNVETPDQCQEVRIDKTPPVTLASATRTDASPYTFGTFSNQDVTVALACTDNVGGSGCAQTLFCVATAACAPSSLYTGTFAITTDGVFSVCYRSSDNVANPEATQCQQVIIDETPPDVAFSSVDAPQDGNMPAQAFTSFPATVGSEPVQVSGTASDNFVVSGVTVNGVTASLSGNTWTAAPISLTPGPNTVTATAVDLAGNLRSASVVITFNPDLDADGTLNRFDNCVFIYNPDQLNSDSAGGDLVGDVCDPCPSDPTDGCPPQSTAAATIGSAGGFIQNSAGEARLDVPAGAVTSPTSFSLMKDTTISAGLRLSTATGPGAIALFAYIFTPSPVTFAQPVTITYVYAQGSLTPAQEAQLGIFLFNAQTGQWTRVSGSSCDAATNTCTASVTSFSRFALAQEIIGASVDIDPNTLNLQSNGKFITATIEFPAGAGDVSTIDLSTVRLVAPGGGEVPAVSTPSFGFVKNAPTADRDGDGLPELLVKFDRASVSALLSPGDATLLVKGLAGGALFEGSDTIRVISVPVPAPPPGLDRSMAVSVPPSGKSVSVDLSAAQAQINSGKAALQERACAGPFTTTSGRTFPQQLYDIYTSNDKSALYVPTGLPCANILFSDNFNDGVLDGWTTVQGAWTITNGRACETTGIGVQFTNSAFPVTDDVSIASDTFASSLPTPIAVAGNFFVGGSPVASIFFIYDPGIFFSSTPVYVIQTPFSLEVVPAPATFPSNLRLSISPDDGVITGFADGVAVVSTTLGPAPSGLMVSGGIATANNGCFDNVLVTSP